MMHTPALSADTYSTTSDPLSITLESAMSEVDAQFVKRGLWTNLDQGNIMGKTITTDSSTGAIIIALMAILSTMGRIRSSCYTID
jgi:hypothetical protein